MEQSVIAEIIRPLTDGDIVNLATVPRKSKAPSLVRLSQRHHKLARMLAEGISARDAGTACGYVPSRVSILQDDPSFKELVSFYREQVDSAYRDLHERLSAISADATDVLADRLETDPEQFDNTELMKLVALGADRTGYGPSSTQNTNVNVNFGARLEAARQRIRAHLTLDGEATEVLDG